MRLAAIRCQNDHCPEYRYRLGDCEINPADPNIEGEWESLEHDARLSGWVSCGDAMYCSERCKNATIHRLADDIEQALSESPDYVRLPNGLWRKVS